MNFVGLNIGVYCQYLSKKRAFKNADDLLCLSMDDLTKLVDKPSNPLREAGLARDAKTYKPVRDAMAHT